MSQDQVKIVPPGGVALPELPQSWRWVYLSQLLTRIAAGKSFKCEERPPTASEHGIVKVSAVTWGVYDEGESKTITDDERVNLDYLIKPGDFLFSRANTIELVGACLIVHVARRKLLLSDKILRFEFAGDFKNWINWMLKSRLGRLQIEALATGNQESMRNIGRERIGRICVPIPPANEQYRIVGKIEELLSELDNGVEALTTARRQLTVYRQSVLKHAFEGKLTEDWRCANRPSVHAVLADIKSERETRTRKKATRLEAEQRDLALTPQVPETWATEYLGNLNLEVFDGPFGSHLKTSDYVESGIRVIRLENIGHGRFIDEKQSFVSERKYKDIQKHTVVQGDIVFSSFVTEVIRSALVPGHIPYAVNKADCFGVRFFGNTINPKFVQFFFQSRNAFKQVEGVIHGVGRPRINTSQLKEVVIPVCSPPEQCLIVDRLEGIFSETDALWSDIERGLSQLSLLRQSILTQAFTGQLVAQDPMDEPASALLGRIRGEREGGATTSTKPTDQGTVKNGKNGRQKAA
jgi:type I restriction enzyme S subunit